MLKDIIEGHRAKINSIQAAAEDALAKGLMRQEAYDLIHEAAMKKKERSPKSSDSRGGISTAVPTARASGTP